MSSYHFLVYVEDHGESSVGADRLWKEVQDKNGNITLISIPRETIDNAVFLDEGNFLVHF